MDHQSMGGRVLNSNNISSFNTVFHTTIGDDKPQVLEWLSSLEPRKRHQHLREGRFDAVGQWIFRTSEFQRWNTGGNGSAHSALFCHGDPGVGKTHLSSLVIDHFYGCRQGTAVTGLYCDYLDSKEQTTPRMLGAILKQLVGRGNIPEDIRKAFEDAKDHFGGVGPRVPELVDMLKMAIAQRHRVVICIDGLDESLPTNRAALLSALRDILRELPNVRLFLTGRPFIHTEVERYFPGVAEISVRPTREDTEAFLRMKLDGDTESEAMDECLRADIMEIIPKTIADIFLLVSLSIDAILAETTIHRRKERLKQMSHGHDVGDVYTSTLERIRTQKKERSRLGMEAILWVAHSERPLEPDELCQALGVEIGSKDLNLENIPSIRTVLNCGLGLLLVDSSSSTVRLVHFTLQEYILANPTLFSSPHPAIAEACLTYLNFAFIKDLSTALRSLPPSTPFLGYASCYWGAHAQRETTENAISLALELLDQFDTHISCKLLLGNEYGWEGPFNSDGRPIGFTGLHGAALLGVGDIMISLFGIKNWDLNAVDMHGDTVLALAVSEGHDCIVKLLLGEGNIKPDMPNKDGRTPLSWAAGNGRGGIAKMLLERNDVNPDTADAHGRTPLSRAAEHENGEIVKMLLERNDVNPDTVDEAGLTPLAWAAWYGHEGIVKMLLDRNDVSPDTADKGGGTPFLWAAGYGHKGVLKLLLQRNDVNPDMADISGRTPLSRAAMNGCQGVVEMLLERHDVNPDAVDESGRTPLSWTIGSGHDGIAKMLLERNNVNPSTADKGGRTPLSWAAENGCEKIVKILLKRNDVNPDTADTSGRTPFSLATMYGHEGIMKMLLQRSDVDPGMADNSGRTPLSWAAEYGGYRIVRILLERSDVNPDTADNSGRAPLSWAAENGHGRIVEMLSKRNDVNSEMVDADVQTPVSWFAPQSI